jgi:hypothetical protein
MFYSYNSRENPLWKYSPFLVRFSSLEGGKGGEGVGVGVKVDG